MPSATTSYNPAAAHSLAAAIAALAGPAPVVSNAAVRGDDALDAIAVHHLAIARTARASKQRRAPSTTPSVTAAGVVDAVISGAMAAAAADAVDEARCSPIPSDITNNDRADDNADEDGVDWSPQRALGSAAPRAASGLSSSTALCRADPGVAWLPPGHWRRNPALAAAVAEVAAFVIAPAPDAGDAAAVPAAIRHLRDALDDFAAANGGTASVVFSTSAETAAAAAGPDAALGHVFSVMVLPPDPALGATEVPAAGDDGDAATDNNTRYLPSGHRLRLRQRVLAARTKHAGRAAGRAAVHDGLVAAIDGGSKVPLALCGLEHLHLPPPPSSASIGFRPASVADGGAGLSQDASMFAAINGGGGGSSGAMGAVTSNSFSNNAPTNVSASVSESFNANSGGGGGTSVVGGLNVVCTDGCDWFSVTVPARALFGAREPGDGGGAAGEGRIPPFCERLWRPSGGPGASAALEHFAAPPPPPSGAVAQVAAIVPLSCDIFLVGPTPEAALLVPALLRATGAAPLLFHVLSCADSPIALERGKHLQVFLGAPLLDGTRGGGSPATAGRLASALDRAAHGAVVQRHRLLRPSSSTNPSGVNASVGPAAATVGVTSNAALLQSFLHSMQPADLPPLRRRAVVPLGGTRRLPARVAVFRNDHSHGKSSGPAFKFGSDEDNLAAHQLRARVPINRRFHISFAAQQMKAAERRAAQAQAQQQQQQQSQLESSASVAGSGGILHERPQSRPQSRNSASEGPQGLAPMDPARAPAPTTM